VDKIAFWDCNASFGLPTRGALKVCASADELVQELDWHGFSGALVYHTAQHDQSPVVGNRVLAEAIAGNPRLIGSWAILPPQTSELPSDASFFRAMEAANVRALWAFPEEHRFLLERLTFGSFLDEVAERRIPLFVRRAIGWPVIYRLMEQYPNLTLVAAAHGPWGEDRLFRPLLERYPNFKLDTSRYEQDMGVSELVRYYGHECLLMGSNYPAAPMGGPRLMIERCDLTPEARRAIAGENLLNLLRKAELS